MALTQATTRYSHAARCLQHMPARYAHAATPAPMLHKRQERTPAAPTAISGMLGESLASRRTPHAGHAARHHAPDRRRAWLVARGVPAAFADPRPRALAYRARDLL